MPLYLGFDCSTQGLTALVIDVAESHRAVVFERTLDFDADLPEYGTVNGVLPSDDPLVARCSPLLWAEALERMMAIVARESGLDLRRLVAISGAAQQHGSVYLDGSASSALAGLSADRALSEQIAHAFTRPDAPIWMDASTARQCAEIADALGGAEAVARLTGSTTFPRFTGPQIRKFFSDDPAAYARTDRIHLVSSYLASLLIGRHAPLEPGDASGMNLMDLATRGWSAEALDATAPGLADKLPPIVPASSVAGTLAPYWRTRFGFPAAKVICWTGDNPSSLIGTGLVAPGDVAVSLGTSDTLFGVLDGPRYDPSTSGHVFGTPTGGYMGLVCCRNGSLARERVRDAYGLDWEGFAAALRATQPGNGGAVMLPWFAPEITPRVADPRVYRYGLDASDAAANVRAVVEAQMLALARHAGWMEARPRVLRATGGAAANVEILRVMADVHGVPVDRLVVGNSSCLGAALRALHGDAIASGRAAPWSAVLAGFVEPLEGARVSPTPAHHARYARLARVYAACEEHALGRGADPAPLIEAFRRQG
ncbi:MAG TPA: FGGY family carbohydrate kinase [Gemmatimonadales bacterium]|nr:FGGY family carbohydrate kinase [Gemmatimonadales bacterium]